MNVFFFFFFYRLSHAFKTQKKKVSFLQNPEGTFPKTSQSFLYSFLFKKSFNAHDALALRKILFESPIALSEKNWSRELWERDIFRLDRRHILMQTFQRKSPSSALPQEEHDWKNIRKWAGIWRSAKKVQQVWKRRAYFTTTFFFSIAITTSDHHGSNFGYNGQILSMKKTNCVRN